MDAELAKLKRKYIFDEITFRSNKKEENYYLTLREKGKIVYKQKAEINEYFYCFLNSISTKESCLNCKYHTAERCGDLTIGDFIGLGEKIPFDPKDATIYYVGPTPAKPGQVIGSAGPTTSGRMDAYAPTMMSVGARGMIGKGARLPEVIDAMKKYHGVYFGAIGGAGALLAKCIKKAELIAYEDLGAEALRKLYVEDMPLVVIIDSEGNNLYEEGRTAYLKQRDGK